MKLVCGDVSAQQGTYVRDVQHFVERSRRGPAPDPGNMPASGTEQLVTQRP